MSLVASISTAIDIAKKLRELDRKVSEADFKMLLAELTSELGDAKLDAANLKTELADAKDRIRELERDGERKASADPEFHDGGYIFGDPARVYCTGCYDTSGKKVLLNPHTGPFKVFGKWSCPSCQQSFGESSR